MRRSNMMSFWDSQVGQVTGSAEDAFTPDFGEPIPNNTTAVAKIDTFLNEKNQDKKYLNIWWLLLDGDFKGRKVSQKIKVFDEDTKVRHRALNMLKYLCDLFKIEVWPHAPSDQNLASFVGKVAGIKIREWSMPKQDGSGMASGNFVSEVHDSVGFQSVTGEKMEVAPVEKKASSFEDDISF